MYTEESREQTRDMIVSALKKDSRITGVILVGSGVYGFKDEYSDIDLTVVVEEELEQTYADWKKHIYDLFPIVIHFEAMNASGVYLYGFLFEDYLELDISFQKLEDLYARRPHWKVLHDSTGKIVNHINENTRKQPMVDKEERLRFYLGELWWYIVHGTFSVRRGHYVKALFHVENVRDIGITLRGIRRGLNTSRDSRFRESDQFTQEFIAEIAEVQVQDLEESELMRALNKATSLSFREARLLEEKLGLTIIGELEIKMHEFLRQV